MDKEIRFNPGLIILGGIDPGESYDITGHTHEHDNGGTGSGNRGPITPGNDD